MLASKKQKIRLMALIKDEEKESKKKLLKCRSIY